MLCDFEGSRMGYFSHSTIYIVCSNLFKFCIEINLILLILNPFKIGCTCIDKLWDKYIFSWILILKLSILKITSMINEVLFKDNK